MNTHGIDIELPPLPDGYGPSIAKAMRDYARAAIEADRKRRGEMAGWNPVDGNAHGYEGDIVLRHKNGEYRIGHSNWIESHLVQPYPPTKPKEAAYVGTLRMGYTSWMALDLPAPQPAEPVKSTCKKCNGTGVESTRFHGVWPNGEECLEPIKCDQCDGFGMTSAAGPVKSHLKVSYDDKCDCLYVVCDSNEPAYAEEDDKGILYRRAISDGRLVGITIMNFMGPHAKWSDDVQRPAEPVHETARTAGNGAESGMSTGSQAGAHDVIPYSGCSCGSEDCRVNGCLSKRQAQSAMAPGGGGMPAEPVKCIGCEGKPAPENNPCAVCGKEVEPVKVPSDADIDAVFNDMPDGANGWMKSWGYRQFARAILARYTTTKE